MDFQFYPSIATASSILLGKPRTVINADCITLGKQLWSDGTYGIDMGREVHYMLLGEGMKAKDTLVNLTGLLADEHKKLDFDEEPKLQIQVPKAISEPEEDLESDFDNLEEGYEEIFHNVGFDGKWKISYNKIFEFKRLPHEVEANYVAIRNGKLVYKEYANNLIEVDPTILRYLRVSYKSNVDGEWIGHVFIENSDEKEIALIGKEEVELYKELQ